MANAIFFSASTGGFYHSEINDAMPSDAIRISRLRHAELMEQQSTGRRIIPGEEGKPMLASIIRQSVDELRACAVRRIKAEASRRILLIASMAQQSNDNALISLAVLDRMGDTAEVRAARTRRQAINAIRARSNALEAMVSRMTRGAVEAFSPEVDSHWS